MNRLACTVPRRIASPFFLRGGGSKHAQHILTQDALFHSVPQAHTEHALPGETRGVHPAPGALPAEAAEGVGRAAMAAEQRRDLERLSALAVYRRVAGAGRMERRRRGAPLPAGCKRAKARPRRRRAGGGGSKPEAPPAAPPSRVETLVEPRPGAAAAEPDAKPPGGPVSIPAHPRPAGEDGGGVSGLLRRLARLEDSRQRAAELFRWLLAPVAPAEFLGRHWERAPLLVRRGDPRYYAGLFSTADFDAALRGGEVQFGTHLDVTSYAEGVRETHNPSGRALPAVVWDFYQNGCSLRLLCPQAFSPTVWDFLSILQEQFGSMAGANTYLTPPGTQGFAPHYDDIEAFVLQLEGKKHWRVYSPRMDAEVLPQFSSPNFTQAELGEPVLETVLEAGDLLYFPRGFIHQGDCLPDAHSLHITVSSFQRNSWGDFLEKLLPAALQMALEEDVEYRRGLPMDYLQYMGVANSETVNAHRTAFVEKVKSLIKKLVDYAPIDAAVDQRAKSFLHDCLPPVLTQSEKAQSVYGFPARWQEGGPCNVDILVTKDTEVRLLRHGIVRLCNEEAGVMLYYTTENSRVYHKEEPKFLELDPEYTDSIEFLLSSYPNYVSVDNLPCETLEEKISLATLLFEKGILTTKKPLAQV
ncbi:LOW QUALITY PROTEIN: ribosomal oxygenase 1 [Malurus melanocephalus]|uniref:LOW QUALITY PROTEIN: ribosomal oxygenase 1 n=1 Tax=Malurus melanocephalus TaxID=175006 RepID=UPI0025489EA0|nr:LOW QUALITY PROTEIN: ribosomal oxygenase 1 [Malurus melanocephalus]